jgi:hypothetical protein
MRKKQLVKIRAIALPIPFGRVVDQHKNLWRNIKYFVLTNYFNRKVRKGFLFVRFYINAKFAKLYQYSFANFAFNERNL